MPHATPLQVIPFASDLVKAKQLIDSSVPELFIQEHAAVAYAARMRFAGNDSWVTPIEVHGLVQGLSELGVANVTIYLCREGAPTSESSPKQLVVCQKISPTAPFKGAPTVFSPC